MKRITWLLLFFVLWIGFGRNQVLAEDSDLCLWYYNDGENNVKFHIYESNSSLQDILEHADFDNLEFFSIEESWAIRFSFMNDDAGSIENKIRLLLLENGRVRIVDESVATQEEMDAQKKAKKQNLGGWENYSADNEQDTGVEDSVLVNWWNNIKTFLGAHLELIISTMAGCGVLGYIFKKFIFIRRKVVFLGGANASGKTTLRNSMMNPDAALDDLLSSSPTLTTVKERTIREDIFHKLSLSASIIDPPGHELFRAIDNLSKYKNGKRFFVKYVVIIILAPCKGNRKEKAEYSEDYINEQYETINKFWIPLLIATSTIRPERVILFINKHDLFPHDDSFDSYFEEHRQALKKACRTSGISFDSITGSVLRKAGFTELMRLIESRKSK